MQVSPFVVVKLLKIFIKIPSQDSVDATFVLLNTCGYKLDENNKKDLNKIVNNVHNKSVYDMRFAKKVNGIMVINRSIWIYMYLHVEDLNNLISVFILYICFTTCGSLYLLDYITQRSNLIIFLIYLLVTKFVCILLF